MKLKQIALGLVSILATSSAFAKNDINLFMALSDAGVQWEQEMSKSYVGVENFVCAPAPASGEPTCTMIDTAMVAEGARVTVTGPKAGAILLALAIPQPLRHPIDLKGITCFRSTEDLIDVEEGEQATCDVR